MELKRSLDFRGNPNESTVTFYNGEEIELFTEDFNLFWNLLEFSKKNGFDINSSELISWGEENNVSIEDLIDLQNLFKDYGMLYTKQKDNSKEFSTRNFNFFSTYDKSEFSLDLYNKVNNLSFLIIGCGTLGSAVALSLSKLGVQNLTLIDFDCVVEKNIMAQYVFNKNHVGMKKIHVLKEELKHISPETIVNISDRKVKDISDILDILESNKFSHVINAFDETNKDLDLDLVDYCSKNKIQYYISGYYRDSIFAMNLEGNQGISIMEDNYSTFNSSYIINDNRGTILHSLIGSFLITNLVTSNLIDESFNGSRQISYNIKNMEFTNKQLFSPPEKNKREVLETLNTIYSFDEVHFTIERIKKEVQRADKKFNLNTVEIDLLNLHQFLDLLSDLDLLEISNHMEHYNELNDLVELIDNLDQVEPLNSFSESEGIESNNIKYMKIIEHINNDRIHKSKENIYTEMTNLHIDTSLSYEKKFDIQKSIYNSVHSHANKLLDIVSEEKKITLNSDFEFQFDKEIIGLDSSKLIKFEQCAQEKYIKLFKTLYPLFSETDNHDTVDYLAYSSLDSVLFDSIEDALLLITNTFKDSYLFENLSYHIQKLQDENRIIIIDPLNNHNINRTLHFSNKNEGIIVINFDGSANAFLTLVHEIGHSYFNYYYSDKKFVIKSNKLINEVLAHFFQIYFVKKLNMDSNNVVFEIKSKIIKKNIEIFSKTFISNFSTRLIELEVINLIKENSLNVENYLKIRQECDKPFINSIPSKNNELFYLNLLLHPYFCFNYKDYTVDALAVVVATSIAFEEPMTNTKLEQFINGDSYELDVFYEKVLNKDFSKTIASHIENFQNILIELSKSLENHTFNNSLFR